MIYKLILALRDRRYRGGRHSQKADVPTVCIGNITVGGTGKTPHTELAVRRLQEVGGYKSIAILSRGYKRRSKGFQQVLATSTADFCGDEPLLLKRRLPEVTVAVDKDRLEGCAILADPLKAQALKHCADPDFPGAEAIVLDDAYQYRRLKADLSVVLTDYSRPVTRDSLLPAGRLRDLKRRLYDADIIIVTKCPYELDDAEKQECARILGFESFDPGTCIATRRGTGIPLLFSGISHEAPLPVFPEADTRYIYSHKLLLMTGIADDTPLRNHLSATYMITGHLRYPDHHRFTKADIRAVQAHLRHNPTSAVFTTEKDAQRLRDLKSIPPNIRERLFYVPITAVFQSSREADLFDQYLHKI